MIAKALRLSEVAQIAKIETRLRDYLLKEWRDRSKKATKKAAEMAERGASSAKITAAIKRIMRPWANVVKPRFNREIEQIYRLARIAGHKKVKQFTKASLQYDTPNATAESHESTVNVSKAASKGFKAELLPSFDVVDDGAIRAIKDQQTLWIGEHFDKNVAGTIERTTREAMETGTVGRAAGKVMAERTKNALGIFSTPKGFTGTDRQYFEGLVANAATVARAQGQMRSFASVGVTYYEIVNPEDERTCPVCGTMSGKIFSTRQGVDQMVRDLEATTPDEMKAAHPWLTPTQINGNTKTGAKGLAEGKGPQGPKEAKRLADAGFSMPPFHFRCRCTVDVSEESTTFENLGDPIEISRNVTNIGRAAGVATAAAQAAQATQAAKTIFPDLPKTNTTPTKAFDQKALEKAVAVKRDGMKTGRFVQYSPAQQAALRKELNALMAENGMVERSIIWHNVEKATDTRDKRDKFNWLIAQVKQNMGNANGKFVENGAIWITRDVQKHAALFAKGARTEAANEAFSVLIHETIHSHSPIALRQLKGAALAIEEATCEHLSRRIMVRKWGVNPTRVINAKTGERYGAYEYEIKTVKRQMKFAATRAVEKAGVDIAEMTADEIDEVLEAAAIKMRSTRATVMRGRDYPRHFARSAKPPARMVAGMTEAEAASFTEEFQKNLANGVIAAF